MTKKLSASLMIFFNVIFCAFAQDPTVEKKDTLDYYEMSLEELLKLKAHGIPSELEELINTLISVSSKKAINSRETPSIVSLITEEEIKNSGARDLIDVLRMVPGIDFGVDVEGVVGLGMRGNWANEGKILVLIDGQETNEIMYATSQLGNRIPIDLIKRIEIIRGPGSAIYGGYAEYGVINIITKQAEDLNGAFASATYGQMTRDFGRKNVSLAAGKKMKDFSLSLSGFLGNAQRSDQIYRDFDGATYDMRRNSDLRTTYFNTGIKYKNLSARLIFDNYKIQSNDPYGYVVPEGPVDMHFENVYAEIKHESKLTEKWKLTSRLNFKNQQPWKNNGFTASQPYNKNAQRTSLNSTASYDANRKLNILFGLEGFYDYAKNLLNTAAFNNGKQQIGYYNYSVFSQSLFKTKYVNIILGARLDKNSAFGEAFVPRVGLTKKIEKFHYKILFGRAFRAPSIENINTADVKGIAPEFTSVSEVEVGYQMTRNAILTCNVFNIETKDPIVYYTSLDSLNLEYYTNSGGSGSKGAEAEYRYKSKWGHVHVNYAYYTAHNKSQIPQNQTSNPSSLLGFANHRVNVNAQANLNKFFSFNLSYSYYSKRYFVSGYDTSAAPIFSETAPMFLVNSFLLFKPAKSGFNVGIGINDLLNQRYAFIQPYDGGHAPLPGPSREIVLRLQYSFNFKKL